MTDTSGPATAAQLERLIDEVSELRKDLAKGPPQPALENEPPQLMTAKEAAVFLGMSESWVYQRSSAGDLPTVRLGHAVRFDREILRAHLRGDHRRTQGAVIRLERKS